ncbi:MAG: DNA replication/repair protein RecF [Alphaproteobacteria bacterium]|nr:DNA replication/repair protein RecF [Alphaproteobacteria bacterium]
MPVAGPAPRLRLLRLTLTDFRSYAALSVRFGARMVVLAGENGAGKTNILEAISLLVPGRGLRQARLSELARRAPPADPLGDPLGDAPGPGPRPWAVAAELETPLGALSVGTGLEPGAPGGNGNGGGNGAAAERRAFRLDGATPRSQAEVGARLAALWLTPQMDRLWEEGPAARRRFLDRLVWALEPAHARELAAYDTAMANRQRLLREAAESGRAPDAEWLAALEDSMARHAVAVAAARRVLLARLNAALAGGIAGAFPAAHLTALCPIDAALGREPALAVEDGLRARWAAERGRDQAQGGTASGAHRSDLAFTHTGKGIDAALCSTGEQKALLVSVVLGHAALVAEARGFAPLLLLDEVAAHLDEARRLALFAALAALPAQVFLTGTEAALFAPLAGLAAGFAVGGGRLDPLPGFGPGFAGQTMP